MTSNKTAAAWQPSLTNQDLQIVTERTVYSGPVTLVERELRFKMFSGKWSAVIKRSCVLRGSSAAVLLYQPEQDMVIMVEQVRSGLLGSVASPWILEPVAGMREEGDDAETTARKEAIEEAGCEVLELLLIGTYLVSPGISNEMTTLFCGRIKEYLAGGIYGLAREHEDIKLQALPAEKAFSLLAINQPLAAGTIISLQWLQLHREQLRLQWS